MRLNVEIPMQDLEQIVSDALQDKYPDMFPEGATVTWITSDNQRDGTSVSARATPAVVAATGQSR